MHTNNTDSDKSLEVYMYQTNQKCLCSAFNIINPSQTNSPVHKGEWEDVRHMHYKKHLNKCWIMTTQNKIWMLTSHTPQCAKESGMEQMHKPLDTEKRTILDAHTQTTKEAREE